MTRKSLNKLTALEKETWLAKWKFNHLPEWYRETHFEKYVRKLKDIQVKHETISHFTQLVDEHNIQTPEDYWRLRKVI